LPNACPRRDFPDRRERHAIVVLDRDMAARWIALSMRIITDLAKSGGSRRPADKAVTFEPVDGPITSASIMLAGKVRSGPYLSPMTAHAPVPPRSGSCRATSGPLGGEQICGCRLGKLVRREHGRGNWRAIPLATFDEKIRRDLGRLITHQGGGLIGA